MAFSTSSFTTEAGRSTTSPAAILLTRCSGSGRMRLTRGSPCALPYRSRSWRCHSARRLRASSGVMEPDVERGQVLEDRMSALAEQAQLHGLRGRGRPRGGEGRALALELGEDLLARAR